MSQPVSAFLDSMMDLAYRETEHLGDTPQRITAIRKLIDPAYQIASWVESENAINRRGT